MRRAALFLALVALAGCAPLTPAERARRAAAWEAGAPERAQRWRDLADTLDRGLDGYTRRPLPYPREQFCSAVTHNCAANVRIVK